MPPGADSSVSSISRNLCGFDRAFLMGIVFFLNSANHREAHQDHIACGGFVLPFCSRNLVSIGDSAFARALGEEWKGLLSFGLLFAVTISSLLYFVFRDVRPVR